jgi:3-deoxy-manno-octulosonate cytidylyltransferase (CMP-KDO synthetase)
MFRVVIPARYASARLPGKVLVGIAGKPMIQWVYERARASRAREVLIATDDLLIVSAAHSFGAQTIMTASTHRSGTDRIAEVARLQRWADSDIVVNVQGDEPLIPAALIDQVGALEQREKLEQLRALENGIEIRVADSLEPPGPDVNTAADLEQVSALLRS